MKFRSGKFDFNWLQPFGYGVIFLWGSWFEYEVPELP